MTTQVLSADLESGVNRELQPLSEAARILTNALKLHKDFDDTIWKRESFHNAEHVNSGLAAALKLVDNALHPGDATEYDDPLGIREDLDRWNESQSPELQLEMSDLTTAFTLAFACHDLGNISELKDGHVGFLPAYKAHSAEARSEKISELFIQTSKIPEAVKRKMIPFVGHLIHQTIYQKTPTGPFGVIMQVCDQIGNHYFSHDPDRLIGLLQEQIAENPTYSISPQVFADFVRWRFRELVPDDNRRHAVLALFKAQEPEPNQNLPWGKITVTEQWIQANRSNLVVGNGTTVEA